MINRISTTVLALIGLNATLFAAAPPAPSETPRSPEESAKMFTVADDLVWEQVLAEPLVAQPVNMNFDERGRLWVVQYRQYPYPEGLKVTSRDNHWRVQYDKVPPAPPNHVRGRDKITIHEDTNGDGKFDKHKTFVDGLNLATAVEIGRGGVWVLNPPYLLFYPDKNKDDVPDGDPEVHLSGFGLSDSHSVVNSLTWGPDGWLYAAQGSTVHGDVVTHAADGSPINDEPVHSMGQLIWRYHPEKRRYEIFAEGGGNAFGVEIDSRGRTFSGHNGGDTRGFHYVQGAYLQKGFSKHGPLSNPYAFGYFPAMPSHKVPRFTHTFVIYEGGTLPDKYQEKLFGVEPLQSQIVLADIAPHGSSFKTDDINRPVTSDDKWFRPVDIKVSPDGAIYVADFFERYPSHREHYDGKVFSNDGRIYRLQTKGAQVQRMRPLTKETPTVEIIQQLWDKNKTVRRIALRVLGDRKEEEEVATLLALLKADKEGPALEFLWAINACGGFDEEVARVGLAHDDPYVRAWTVRLLCDERTVSDNIAAKLAGVAKDESHVEVRTQLACSARRLPAKQGLPIVRELLTRDADESDVYQPLLLWWALETNCTSDPDAALDLFASGELWDEPLVQTHITHRLMRRFAAAGTQKDLAICARLFALAPQDEYKQQLLKGFEEAFQGRALANLPDELVRQINDLGGGSLALRVRGGDAEALAAALKTITDDKADKTIRRELIAVFAEAPRDEAVDALLQITKSSNDLPLRVDALAALEVYNQSQIGLAALDLFAGKSLPSEVSEAALALLTSRPAWTQALLAAVDSGRLRPEAIDPTYVRKMLLHDDTAIAAAVQKHWGEVDGATSDQMRAQVKRLTEVVRDGSGDPYAGKKLYLESCAKCHKLFEEGEEIGPNLTSYQRDNVEAMLLNVVNPSAEIREGFQTQLVIMLDGRVLTGFLADQDMRLIVLRTSDGQSHTIARDDIEEMRPAPRSIMPENLLDALGDQQVRDLLAYLRSRQPLND